jgi:hypothetical protein
MMTGRSVAEKAHVKPDTAVAVIDPEPDVVAGLGLPASTRFVDPADARIVMLFVRGRAELENAMPAAVQSLPQHSHLWVFFRKGSKASGLDMSRNDVWAVAEQANLRPVGLLSVDDTWSAFRFRRGP